MKIPLNLDIPSNINHKIWNSELTNVVYDICVLNSIKDGILVFSEHDKDVLMSSCLFSPLKSIKYTPFIHLFGYLNDIKVYLNPDLDSGYTYYTKIEN